MESALPIERLQKRLGVVAEISESMDNILTDAQMDKWSDFRAASESALRGVLRIRDLPIDVEPGDSDPVVDQWKTGYSLDNGQVEFATTLAEEYCTLSWSPATALWAYAPARPYLSSKSSGCRDAPVRCENESSEASSP